MNPVTAAAVEPIPLRRYDPERRRLEELVDELAALVAREHSLRARAESAAAGLTLMLSHAMGDAEEARKDRNGMEEVADQLAILVAHEKAERDRADALAREALFQAEAEREWRRRLKAADRRTRKELLKQL